MALILFLINSLYNLDISRYIELLGWYELSPYYFRTWDQNVF
jgi:hypothetical protein